MNVIANVENFWTVWNTWLLDITLQLEVPCQGKRGQTFNATAISVLYSSNGIIYNNLCVFTELFVVIFGFYLYILVHLTLTLKLKLHWI